ncbi:hypothetical protein DB30_00161 [Enhygromyxa salina]|uniref:DUF1449 family protein n=1 Tax=Enhygromyxa salina TaxID=215803 RepID=A0A0C2DJ02_9BACT|nr:hypothetical protein [Enhygromyxa salina]KIG19652.1 hypothetical protein DB30_00161 [Enhygromyxa salina]
MTEFLLAALTFPAVVFTTLLGIVLGYWAMVTVGVFSPDALEGVVDGALEGAVEGATALSAPRDEDPAEPGALALREPRRGFLAKYELRRVPVTVSFSLFTLFGWALTHGTTLLAGSVLDGLVARGLWGSGVMLLAMLISLRLTSWAIVPIAPFFSDAQSLSNDDMIGQIARVQTIRVTRKVGQATLNTTGGSLNVTIRADESLGLTKNERVMLVSYDPQLRAFEVERIDDMLPSEVTKNS